jgi:hypothetical protein
LSFSPDCSLNIPQIFLCHLLFLLFASLGHPHCYLPTLDSQILSCFL